MNRNRRYFLSSRAHHDQHNLTPGLLRALILLFSIQSFVSPVECSFSGSELLTSGNRDGEKTSYKTPEGANKPTLLPYWALEHWILYYRNGIWPTSFSLPKPSVAKGKGRSVILSWEFSKDFQLIVRTLSLERFLAGKDSWKQLLAHYLQ